MLRIIGRFKYNIFCKIIDLSNEQYILGNIKERYRAEEDITSVQTGLTVKYADCEAVIDNIGENGDMGYVCDLATKSAAADGFYEGKVVVKSYKPLSFVLN